MCVFQRVLCITLPPYLASIMHACVPILAKDVSDAHKLRRDVLASSLYELGQPPLQHNEVLVIAHAHATDFGDKPLQIVSSILERGCAYVESPTHTLRTRLILCLFATMKHMYALG